MMQNEEIAKVFEEIASMLEVAGENFFRVRAYRNAARAIHDQPTPVADMSLEQIDAIPGIGPDLAEKIRTVVETGDLPLRRELAAKFPPELLGLAEIPGLGPKRLKLLIDELAIRGKDDLERMAKAGRLRAIRGFGPKIERRILESLARRQTEALKRLLFSEAEPIAQRLVQHLRKCRWVKRLEVAGSFRRRQETIGDLDIVVAAERAEPVKMQFTSFPDVAEVLGSGETKTTVVLKGGLHVDLRLVPRDSFGAAVAYFTGSKAHNIHLRRIAQERGLLLNEYGLFKDGSAIAGKTEQEIYRALGLPWIVPELREDRGEIEAAYAGRLPSLLDRSSLRGDLHTHTSYTDGRGSVDEMARAARAAGLEYFAITDHSRRVAMAHGLDAAGLRKQGREIERVRKRPTGITILRGIEVDILEDGSLDLPDDVLASLDWVVASVHYKLDQDAAAMTRRLIKALGNRNVDAIGHPSGRLIGHRPASEFELSEVLHAAREEGCALEVNSQPNRLDLTDIACMAAKRAGVKLVISSDSHSPGGFKLLDYGVSQARRGWIEADDVLNTKPLKELRRR